jgi:serine/threonine protein kinase
VQALVLEFVEGPTLAERIGRERRIPLRSALAIARQIASALESAHERGIVHRDLKPANIKVTPAGHVKILDFGIARATDADARSRLPGGATGPGVVLGTPAYMSPEQARGQAVDKRSDIWAFGCVLYEMLTGRGAFAEETGSDSLAKVIERDPDWTALPSDVPPPIRRLIARCLRKDAADRIHDAADARLEIADALAEPTGNGAIVPAANRRWMTPLMALAAASLVAFVLAVWWRGSYRLASPSAQLLEFGVTFPSNFNPTDGVAISPDGRMLAVNVWSNAGNIWVHSFDGSQPKPLAGGESASYPFWSPDSKTLGFFQVGGQIVTMSPFGGAIARIATMRPQALKGGASWNRDNVIVFSDGAALFRVPATGVSPPVEIPITGLSGVIRGPTFLPDGRHVLFCVENAAGGSIAVAPLEGGTAKILGESQCPGGFAPPDYALFVRGGSLLAQRLDLERLSLAGQPQLVASGVNRGAVGPWPALTVSASETGVLALPSPRGGSSIGQLTWFNRNGQAIGAIENRSGDQAENLNGEISPTNEHLVAVNRLDPQTGAWHIWLIDTSRGDADSRLTTESASDMDPIWSPDGREILYSSDRGGTLAFYRQSIDGGVPKRVLDVSGISNPIPSDWSEDGYILFQRLQQSIWALRLGEQVPMQLADRQPQSYAAHLSPDGRWLAYASVRGGTFEVFVEQFPGGLPRKQISAGGGVHPRWTNGGKELVYWAPPGGIVANALAFGPDGITVGPPKTLVAQPVLTLIDARTHFDITRDGRKILMRQAAGPPSPGIRVIVNWSAKLK